MRLWASGQPGEQGMLIGLRGVEEAGRSTGNCDVVSELIKYASKVVACLG